MASTDTELSVTTALCPTCLERVPGTYEARDDAVYLTRDCDDHGIHSRQVWESVDHWEWASGFSPAVDPPSTDDGSDLVVDNDHACLAVVEVTQACNLACSFCFASSGPGGRELAFGEVVHLLDVILESGGPRPIQFSGGEPTIRDDLPELVERATEMGFEHVEVNTNGIVLGREGGYAERLVEAGVTAIYLQFDGLEADTYEQIRDVDLVAHKHAAIEACRRADLPVILVPTVVPGVNDHEMGAIVEFALDNGDVVQSVNFQPVSKFGRYADPGHEGRFSLDAAAECLAAQVDALEPRDLLPAPCCSAYCQSGTALVPNADGNLVPLTRFLDEDLWKSVLGSVDEADWMEFLAKTDTGQDLACGMSGCCGSTPEQATDLFDAVLPVTLTGFMDADAADVTRLGNCCLSVPTPDGDLVPFCAYNMTTDDGDYALRTRHGWGGRSSVSTGDRASVTDIEYPSPRPTGSDDD